MYPCCVLTKVTLVCNKNPTTVKIKETVNKDTPSVEEVVDLREYEGAGVADAVGGGTLLKRILDRCSETVVDIAEGNTSKGGGKSGGGADDNSVGSE